jgi:hypothetical protein
MVMKIKGTGPEQVEAAKKIAMLQGINIPEPKVGGQNVMAVFKKTDLDKVLYTETEHEPHIPPQPPAFTPKGLPVGCAILGTSAPVNRHDLGASNALTMGQAGYAVRMGKHGIFRDNQVYCRRAKDSDGKVWTEVFGVLEEEGVKPKSLTDGMHSFKSTANTHVPGYEYEMQTYDPVDDTQVEGTGSINNCTAYVGKTEGGSSVSRLTGGETMGNSFVVRIPPGGDVEKELAAAYDKMGLDVEKAMATPDTDDVRKATKLAMVRAIKGPGAFGDDISHEQKLSEKWLDSQLEGYEDKVAGAEWKWVGPGKQAPVVNDTAEIKKAGVLFPYVSQSGLGSVVARLKEGFMASNKRKYHSGVVGHASSATSDMGKGGGNSVFMRFGNESSHIGGYKDHNVQLVFHPRLLNRLDWYAHNGDQYGATSGHNSRYDSLKFKDSSNEILFQDTVSLRDLAAVRVASSDQKKKLIAMCEAAGLPKVFNGIPLEKFIIASGSGCKDVADLAVGLQEGVLP